MKKLLMLSTLGVVSAFAHTTNVAGGFFSGLTHPISGLDHMLAMIAVGAVAAMVSNKKLIFSSFMISMIIAAFVALGTSFALVGMENIILASIFVIGTLIYFSKNMPKYFLSLIIAFFGFSHGFAHGAEFVEGNFLTYVLGFSSMTLVLHFIGFSVMNYVKSFKLGMAK